MTRPTRTTPQPFPGARRASEDPAASPAAAVAALLTVLDDGLTVASGRAGLLAAAAQVAALEPAAEDLAAAAQETVEEHAGLVRVLARDLGARVPGQRSSADLGAATLRASRDLRDRRLAVLELLARH